MRTPGALLRPMPLFLALAFLLVAAAVLPAAQTARPDSVLYDAYANGKKVGRVSLCFTEQEGDNGPLLKTTFSMKLSFRVLLIVKISVDLWQETLRREDGAYSFYRQAKGPGHKVVQKGYYDGSKLVCDTEVKGETKHQEFDNSLFDYTSLDMDYPAADLSPGEEKTVRVLNLESLKVRNRTFHCLRDEDLCVGNDTVACKVLGNSKDDKDLEWITRDSSGIMIKQESVEPHVVSFRPVRVIWNHGDSL